MIVSDASPSAQTWARVPASAAGAVAPAWGPVWQWIGMPASTAAQATSRLSGAKVRGETTVVACTVQKGRCANRAFAAGERVEHRYQLRHVLAQRDAGGDVLLRPRRAGIDGVRVEFEQIIKVRGDHRAGEPLEVLEGVAQARQIVDVAQGAWAVAAGIDVEHLHRRAAGAEVHRAVARLEIELGVAAVDGEAPGGLGERILDQAARIEQPSRLAERAAMRKGRVSHALGRRGHPHALQQLERGPMDARHIGVAQGTVGSREGAAPDHGLPPGGAAALPAARLTSA